MNELREQIGKIVKEAIEAQMDFESYYGGYSEEPTDQIMQLLAKREEEILEKAMDLVINNDIHFSKTHRELYDLKQELHQK